MDKVLQRSMLTLNVPTGEEDYPNLTIEFTRQYVAFTAGDKIGNRRIALPLTSEHGMYYAEYEGRMYPIVQFIGGAITVFYQIATDLFLRMVYDTDGKRYRRPKQEIPIIR